MQTQNHNIKETPSRALIVDLIRGFAVFLMIIFHFSYDLNLFGFITINLQNNPFWYLFPRVIVFLFLFCVGISLTLTHLEKFKLPRYARRLALLGGCSAIVSLSTYHLFKDRWIYFGTLHCITFLGLVGPIFIKSPRTSLILGILLFTFDFLGFEGAWIKLSHASMDYISPFPWMGAFLLGITVTHFKSGQLLFLLEQVPKTLAPLKFLGKHSLIIYLIHQPILFGSLWIVRSIVLR